MSKTTIYTKTGCPYCKQAIEDYEAKEIDFEVINTSEDSQARQMVKEEYEAKRVPVIIKEGELVSIGYDGGG